MMGRFTAGFTGTAKGLPDEKVDRAAPGSAMPPLSSTGPLGPSPVELSSPIATELYKQFS